MNARARDLSRVLAVAALTQLTCAWLIGGRLHPDETHQYLEVAHRYVWGYGTRPHEWYSGMRNVVAPGAIAGVFKLLRALGVDDPRVYIGAVHALVGALSLTVCVCAYDLVARVDRSRAFVVALTLALWSPWQNLAFRTLGETFSAITLMLALRAWERPSRNHFAIGAWLAMGFVFRYPAGVFLLPFAYALRRDLRGLALWSAGVALVLVALGAVDLATWGSPWHSLIAYADFNLVHDRARIDYGARPAWFYLVCTLAFAPVALLVASVRGASWRRGAMPLAVTLTYLALMSALAHKEPRFFLTIVPAMVVAAGLIAPPWSARTSRIVIALCLAQSLAVIAAYRRAGVCEGDAVRAAEWVGRQPSVGAVALVGVSHPGYVHLHRNVVVYGDSRNDVSRALSAIGGAWSPPTAGAFFAIVRGESASRTLRVRGWRELQRVGEVEVLALP